MSIASRTSELRKSLGLTQQAFADRLGITRGAVSKYDIDATDPSDAVISLICREFNVREAWLRDGVGAGMVPAVAPPDPPAVFRIHTEQRTRREDIALYLGKVSSGKASELEELILDLMAETTADEWLALAARLRRITERRKKENGD